MYSTSAKIIKPNGEKPDDLELSLSKNLIELATKTDMKASLQELHITAAKEMDAMGKKAIAVFVPVPQLRQYHKIQVRLVRELEKKYSGKHIVILGQRRVLPKPTRKSKTKNKQKRPRSRTLTMVQDNMLEDLCFPAEIVGKRTRVRLDGTRLHKVHLNKNQETVMEHKLDTFSAVYRKLTGKEVVFEFVACDPEELVKKAVDVVKKAVEVD